MRIGWLRRMLALSSAALAWGCVDLTTDPDEIAAIEFEEFPFPAVVAGDTLRDSVGVVAPLRARVFDASGRELPPERVQPEFISRDPLVRIVRGPYAVALPDSEGTARLLASVAGLQSITRQLDVVRRPDSLAAAAVPDTLRWVLPDVPSTNLSQDLRVRVIRRGPPVAGVRRWLVSFQAYFQGQPVVPGDTSVVYLVDESGRPSQLDTSDVQGFAGRRVRVRGGSALPPRLDSVVVLVRARERGSDLSGSPLRLVLPIRPR